MEFSLEKRELDNHLMKKESIEPLNNLPLATLPLISSLHDIGDREG